MGAADALIIVGGIAILGYLGYAHATGQLSKWLEANAQGGGAAVPVDKNPYGAAPDNKCFPAAANNPVTAGKLYCQCKGTRTPFLMGAARKCSDCEAHCRGAQSASFAQSFASFPMKGLIVA